MAWVTNAFCSIGDVEIAVGGAARLLQLADFNRTGDYANVDVQAVIAGWALDAAAEIRTAAEVKHDPETLGNLDEASLRRLNDVNAALAGRAAFEKGTGGLAITEQLGKRAERGDTFLQQLAEGARRLGRVVGGKVAAINQPVGVVDYDRLGVGISITGFKRGFR